MSWLIDLGNTRLKATALPAGEELGEVRALAHGLPGFASELSDWAAGISAGERVWLASVASPAVTDRVRLALQSVGANVLAVRVLPACAGVSLGQVDAGQLGVDRFLAVLGAWRQGTGPWLLVSIGSAVTVDLLDASGQHRGGLIAATPEHLRQALAQRFPVLDRDGGEFRDFASTTADALASGAMASTLGLIERCQRQAVALLVAPPAVLLCGGGAMAVSTHLPLPHRVEPYLVLQGLARYARAEVSTS